MTRPIDRSVRPYRSQFHSRTHFVSRLKVGLCTRLRARSATLPTGKPSQSRTPMAAPSDTSEFLALLEKSGLLSDEEFAGLYPDEDAIPETTHGCAANLIQRGVVTKYQAKMLLAGKCRGFRVGQYVIQNPIGQGGMG